jgi:hypothetical protein
MCVLTAFWLSGLEQRKRWIVLQVSATMAMVPAMLFCFFFLWFNRGVPIALGSLSVTVLLMGVCLARADTRVVALAIGFVFALLLGGVYPSLGINAIPPGIETMVGRSPVATFKSVQPSMLSMRIKRSVKRVRWHRERERRFLSCFDGYLFVKGTHADEFESLAEEAGLRFAKQGEFTTFFSRGTWVQFAKEGTGFEEWKRAFMTRSLDALESRIVYYRVMASESADHHP